MPPFADRHPSTTPAVAAPPAAPEIITVRTRVAGRRTTVSVAGELDLATVPLLRSAITAALDSGTPELCIDLWETDFMDSAGLHLLVDAEREVRGLCRRLTIVCRPGPVRRIFDIAGLAELLPLREDPVHEVAHV